jgi:hypothetical protein
LVAAAGVDGGGFGREVSVTVAADTAYRGGRCSLR